MMNNDYDNDGNDNDDDKFCISNYSCVVVEHLLWHLQKHFATQ